MSKTEFQKQFTSGNTTIIGNENSGSVTLYQTVVASWTPEQLVLDHGGYPTVTTKAQMNQVLKALGVNGSIYSEGGWPYFNSRDGAEPLRFRHEKVHINR